MRQFVAGLDQSNSFTYYRPVKMTGRYENVKDADKFTLFGAPCTTIG
jgi:hypothetical protein